MFVSKRGLCAAGRDEIVPRSRMRRAWASATEAKRRGRRGVGGGRTRRHGEGLCGRAVITREGEAPRGTDTRCPSGLRPPYWIFTQKVTSFSIPGFSVTPPGE
jgi:hypothetical protein